MVSGYSLTVKRRVEILGTRERMVEAAERVMRERGLARSTTREIAREAGFSEGALYKHFDSKEELFLHVLAERLPSFVALSKELPGRAGVGTVGETLGEVARTSLAFFAQGVPIIASIFSEPALLSRHAQEIRRKGGGPHRANEAVSAYLRAEQDLGRVREDADPEAAAAMLLGACFQRAFLRQFLAEEVDPAGEERFAEDVVGTLMRSLSPTAVRELSSATVDQVPHYKRGPEQEVERDRGVDEQQIDADVRFRRYPRLVEGVQSQGNERQDEGRHGAPLPQRRRPGPAQRDHE